MTASTNVPNMRGQVGFSGSETRMTTHKHIAVLLIALLIGCPFVCLAQAGPIGCACPGEDQRQCCGDEGCCPHELADRDAPTDDSPSYPDPDCACRGALLEQSTVERPESGAEETIVLLLDLGDDTHSQSLPAALGSPHSSHFSLLATGRDICVLTCALLL